MTRFIVMLGVSAGVHACLFLLASGPATQPARLAIRAGVISVDMAPSPASVAGPSIPLPKKELDPVPQPIPDATPLADREIKPIVEPQKLKPAPLLPEPTPEPIVAVPTETKPTLEPVQTTPEAKAKAPPKMAPAKASVGGTVNSSPSPPGERGAFSSFNTGKQMPVYPLEARRRRMEGQVVFWIHVSEQGRLLELKLVKSSGYALLDDAATTFLRQARWSPALLANQPIDTAEEFSILFYLVR